MRGKVMFLSGLAAGFVLGSRAGRQAYDRLVINARKVTEQPTVREAAGVAKAQATRLYEQGKDLATEKLGNTKFGERIMSTNGHDALAEPKEPKLPASSF
jgi:hypothetical protein